MKEQLSELLEQYKEELLDDEYTDLTSHLVDCADLILDDLHHNGI